MNTIHSTHQLNDDCWWLIIHDQLRTDYTTLSRLLCTSKTLLRLAAPVLYGSLFDPNHPRHQMDWSQNKTHRLISLLLLSGGLVDQDGRISKNITWFPSTVDKHEQDLARCKDEGELLVQPIWLQDLQLTAPTTLNYFSLLTHPCVDQLQSIKWVNGGSRILDDRDFCENSLYKRQLRPLELSFAHLLTELEIYTDEIQDVLKSAAKFPKLNRLRLAETFAGDKRVSEDDKQGIVDFVCAHEKLYPRVLGTVDSSASAAVWIAANHELKPTFLEVAIRNDMDDLESIDCSKDGSWDWTRHVTKLSSGYPSNAVKTILRHSTNLEELHLQGHRFDSSLVEGFFHASFSDETDQSISSPRSILSPSLSQVQQWSLPPIEDIALMDSFASLAQDGLSLFRNTLKSATIHGHHTRETMTHVSFDWSMMTLVRLELSEVALDLCSIQHCPNLEVLEVKSSVIPTSMHYWKAPPKIRELTMTGICCKCFDFSSLKAVAKQLEVIDFDYLHVYDDFDSDWSNQVFLQFETWNREVDFPLHLETWPIFDSLQRLRLCNAAVDRFIPLVKLAPNLVHLCTPPRIQYNNEPHSHVLLEILKDIGPMSKIECLEIGFEESDYEVLEWLTNKSPMNLPQLWALESGVKVTKRRTDLLRTLRSIMSRPKMEMVGVWYLDAGISGLNVYTGCDFYGPREFPPLTKDLAKVGSEPSYCTLNAIYGQKLSIFEKEK